MADKLQYDMKFYKLIFSFLIILSGFITLAIPSQKEILFLSGTDNINTKTWDFFCTSGRNSGVWTKIEVPSHWEQQGFGGFFKLFSSRS